MTQLFFKKGKSTYHQILYVDTDDPDQSKSLREHTHQALKLHLPPCKRCKNQLIPIYLFRLLPITSGQEHSSQATL